MTAYLIDTNFILRYLIKDNRKQFLEVQRYIELAESKEVVLKITSEVVLEVEYVLRKIYKVPRQEISETLLVFLKNDIFIIEKKTAFIRALSIYAKKSIDLVDVLLFEQARDEKSRILTFDKDLQRL